MRRELAVIVSIFQPQLVYAAASFCPVRAEAHPTSGWRLSRTILAATKDEQTVVIIYHKPPNMITSHSNNDAARAGEADRSTVYDDIATMAGYVGSNSRGSFQEATGIQSKLHAIGRLDAETTGLLLLTNDGALVHHVTNPKAHADDTEVTKTYEAVIMGHYENSSSELQTIREEGLDIGAKYGGMTQPARRLQVLDHPTTKSTLISITIAEGKNRQVRRMFHAIRSGVMKLKRTNIGSTLDLEGLEEGQWRLLSDDEIRVGLGWKPRNIVLQSFKSNEGSPNRQRVRSRRSKPRKP
jgi:pseudouridine synthase